MRAGTARSMNTPHVALTLLRFQLRAGARVAVRTTVPTAMALVGVVVLYGSPAVILGAVATLLFPPRGSIQAALLASGLFFAVSRAAACRLTLGLGGWIRHLPVSSSAQRRAVTAGLVAVQGPALAVVLAGGLAVVSSQPATTLPRLLGLPLLAWGAALAAVGAGWTRWVAAAGAISAWAGSWWGPLLSAGLLLLAETAARPVDVETRRRAGRWANVSRARQEGEALGAAAFWTMVSRRAIGIRVARSWLTSLLAVGPTLLFLRNNSLTPGQEEAVARLGGLAAAVLAIAILAEALVKRRPPWPWARSLPWPARLRVGLDAALLGAVALPSMAVALAVPSVIPSLLATVPWLALRGAAEIRRAPGHQGGTARLLLEGGLVGGLVTLVPWVAWGLLAATPVALGIAAGRERRQEISRWHELHHVAAGDPLSWSDA